MRLWSLHPRYLDAKGLVAVWREGLLAQAVLRDRTQGYRHHPQLFRFRNSKAPVRYVAAYLRAVHEEAASRGYEFDVTRLARTAPLDRLPVTRGQLAYEWQHLCAKLAVREPDRLRQIAHVKRPQPHPIFRVVEGAVAEWEVVVAKKRGTQ